MANKPDVLANVDDAEFGRAMKAFIKTFEAETEAVPLGAEDRQKGQSVYNWRSAFLRELKAVAPHPNVLVDPSKYSQETGGGPR